MQSVSSRLMDSSHGVLSGRRGAVDELLCGLADQYTTPTLPVANPSKMCISCAWKE